jgi:hypothetical protein
VLLIARASGSHRHTHTHMRCPHHHHCYCCCCCCCSAQLHEQVCGWPPPVSGANVHLPAGTGSVTARLPHFCLLPTSSCQALSPPRVRPHSLQLLPPAASSATTMDAPPPPPPSLPPATAAAPAAAVSHGEPTSKCDDGTHSSSSHQELPTGIPDLSAGVAAGTTSTTTITTTTAAAVAAGPGWLVAELGTGWRHEVPFPEVMGFRV